MAAGNNVWSDVSSIAQRVEVDAILTVREVNVVEPLITSFGDMSGMNLRRGYTYNSVTVNSISDADDLSSQTFTPSADQTLTPAEYGAQFFITDARAESDLPENILNDAALELGLGAADAVMTNLCGDFSSLTGGTIGAAGSTITFGYLSAAIAVARNANNSASKPLVGVIHGYQAEILASGANVAGASTAPAPQFTEMLTTQGLKNSFIFTFMGVPFFQVFQTPDASDDFTGGIFPKEALAIDWRRQVRIRPERDESRRGLELNMSMIYAHGVWRPDRGVQLIFDASTPSS